MLAANPKRQENIESLLAGDPPMTTVPFPKDPNWAGDVIFGPTLLDYYNTFKGDLEKLKVPELMTVCDIIDTIEDKEYDLTVRLKYHSMVLEPVEWVLHKEPSGLPILGNGLSRWERTTERTETVKLSAKADISASGSIKGVYKVISGALGVEGGLSGSWDVETKVTIKEVTKLEPTAKYQPTRFFAKLRCRVVQAKTGEFAVHNFFEKEEDLDLITTNAHYEKLEYKHRASQSGYVKTREEFDRLYRACGIDLTTTRSHFSFPKLRVSFAKLQVAVDPTDARLYVSGTGGCDAYTVFDLIHMIGVIAKGLMKLTSSAPQYSVPPLKDGRGLWGKEAKRDVLEDISFSSGRNVLIWDTAIKISS